jgi:LysM repeat protein
MTLLISIGIGLAACTLPDPPQSTTPRPTAPTILEITPAPTQDIDATATAYALLLVPTPTPAGLYIVQPGDTLSALAEAFGTTVAEIMAANGLTDPDALQVGQPLLIPSLVDTSPSLRLSPTPDMAATTVIESAGTTMPAATALTPASPTPTLATP